MANTCYINICPNTPYVLVCAPSRVLADYTYWELDKWWDAPKYLISETSSVLIVYPAHWIWNKGGGTYLNYNK